MENASYQYSAKSEIILKKLKLDIEKGEKIAVLGRTGCGKSTLVLGLLNLIQPVEGSLKIDGVSGDFVGGKQWRSEVASVP